MDSWEYYCPTRNHTYQSSFYVVKWTVFWIITGVINVSNSWVVLLQRRDTPFTLPFSSSLWLKPEHDFRLQGRRCWKAEECVGVAEYLNRRDIYHRHRPAILALNYWNSWRRQWHPTPVLLPGKSHGWRSLVGGSPWGRRELDTTERLHFHFSLSCIGEGNGNPLQCSCLENPRDGEALWAAVYGVAQSQTRLKWLSSSTETLSVAASATGAPSAA